MSEALSTPRRRGRPRRVQRDADGPPAEEILQCAGRLFARKGFEGTSTREIAEAAGIQQPSLFYYFSSKEDILRALTERALVRPLTELRRVQRWDAPAAVRLYRIVHFQAEHLASDPLELAVALHAHLDLPQERFPEWFRQVASYTRGIRRVIKAGVEDSEFRSDVDDMAAAMAILGMCNWTLRWFRPDGRLTPQTLATQLADMALRGLLADPDRLDEIAAAAGER